MAMPMLSHYDDSDPNRAMPEAEHERQANIARVEYLVKHFARCVVVGELPRRVLVDEFTRRMLVAAGAPPTLTPEKWQANEEERDNGAFRGFEVFRP